MLSDDLIPVSAKKYLQNQRTIKLFGMPASVMLQKIENLPLCEKAQTQGLRDSCYWGIAKKTDEPDGRN